MSKQRIRARREPIPAEQGGGYDIALFLEDTPTTPFGYVPMVNGITLLNDLVLALRGEQFDREGRKATSNVVQSVVLTSKTPTPDGGATTSTSSAQAS